MKKEDICKSGENHYLFVAAGDLSSVFHPSVEAF